MVAWHLRKMGYRPKMPPAGSYKTARSARAALTKAGHATLADALDAMGFERIGPASALAGDIIEGPADGDSAAGLGALGVALGNGRVLGFHPDVAGAVALQPIEYLPGSSAWRVNPA